MVQLTAHVCAEHATSIILTAVAVHSCSLTSSTDKWYDDNEMMAML